MSRPSYDRALDGEESEDDQHSILLDDDKASLNTEPIPTHSKTKLYIATIILIIPLVFLITPLTRILSPASKSSPDESSTPSNQQPLDLEECGLSPTSALQSNCVFDPTLMGWVPIRCHDANLASEFLSREERGLFYRDEDHNSTMPLEEVMEGEWEYVYVSWEFQVLHCMYSWKKTWQAALNAVEEGGITTVLDGYVGDAHHTNHCEMWMMQGREGIKELGVYMKYVGCPKEGERGEVGRFGWYRVLGGKRVYRNE
ncbi:hypothetical protein QBC45DRAFT_385979 [Copromyces sp. CBS 386.78]|nr:hypothetical protein QBC45DRAFT_385979 [Copromyces sp. CBS 386.78]